MRYLMRLTPWAPGHLVKVAGGGTVWYLKPAEEIVVTEAQKDGLLALEMRGRKVMEVVRTLDP